MSIMAPRIVYLLPADGFGGAERQGVYHLAELPRHGVEVTGFVGASSALSRALSEACVECRTLHDFPPAAPRKAGPLHGVGRAVKALLGSVAQIERTVRGQGFDLIFANRSFAWIVAAELSRRLGIPYVIRAGSRPAHPALGPALGLMNLAARPRAVFYNCRAVRQSIASWFDCPAYELPNAVDLERFRPSDEREGLAARARLGIEPRVPVVGLAARPAPEKGFELFEDVVAKIRAARPDVVFAVAGEFAFRAAYEERLLARGLGGAVRFLGHVADVAAFFRAVDVVILTSRQRSIEASPNALLEAMASARAIVSTAVGGVPELVRHGVEGLLSADGDTDMFARNVLCLLGSRRMRGQMGTRGRARAVSGHRPAAIVEVLARDLRGLLVPHRQPVLLSPGASCESIIPSAPPSTSSSESRPSRASLSSRGAAI